MTAVAPPLTFQSSNRLGWASNGNGSEYMNSTDVNRMFTAGPRKTAQRQNSSSSINSATSTNSNATIQAANPQVNGTAQTPSETSSWAARKKPSRGLWPPGKAEPATGLSTARPQTVSSAVSGPSASSAISALHAPLLPSQQMANGTAQQNGMRGQPQQDTQVILHLLPMNNTFERKTITVPYAPDVLRIGRQTNQKTIPTPLNGYFDSKVLSRQHAEVWADRQGRVFIRDVKSSNGTFVNGMRLSQENKESEPRELREQDVLELGIDIVSEDQKTVVHHKVAAKVEHSGLYAQGSDALNFGEMDPNTGAPMAGPGANQLRRTGSQGAINGRNPQGQVMNQGAGGMRGINQAQHMPKWLNPITTEHIVKKLNAEMRFALQQSQDLARARQSVESMLGVKIESPALAKDSKSNSERSRLSPTKSKSDLKTHFSEPPAPPPSAPLPEKPDVARALADPLIQPLLRRSDTARPPSSSSSPTRSDHSSDILRLCEELKLAKGEISNQSQRMKNLEDELAHERTARESAEERAQRLEKVERRDSPRDSFTSEHLRNERTISEAQKETSPDLQVQLERLRASMDEMRMQMESYRRRAEIAEADRDEARQSLADMIEQRRRANTDDKDPGSPSASQNPSNSSCAISETKPSATNGHIIEPAPSSPTSGTLLERAGVEDGRPITPEQAKLITAFLSQEVLHSRSGSITDEERWAQYYGIPLSSAMTVLAFGVAAMLWFNRLPVPRVEQG